MVKKKTTQEEAKKNDTTSLVKDARGFIDKLLLLIGAKAEAEVNYDKVNESINVNIKTEEEAGLLIGKNGETINALQRFVALSLRQKTNEWHRVLVNVADWREKQQMHLEQIAAQAAERARETKEPQSLYNLTPAQRRIIHMFLANENDIKTESVGEGEERYLIVTFSE
jgi:spoIIIJ-associated protein